MRQIINGKYFDIPEEEMEEVRKHLPKVDISETVEERVQKLERLFNHITPFLEKLGMKTE